jgi:hypothetical protein
MFMQRTLFHLPGSTAAQDELEHDFAERVAARFGMDFFLSQAATPKRVAGWRRRRITGCWICCGATAAVSWPYDGHVALPANQQRLGRQKHRYERFPNAAQVSSRTREPQPPRRRLRSIPGGYDIDRWPLCAPIGQDETVGSWLMRAALRNGMTPRVLLAMARVDKHIACLTARTVADCSSPSLDT